MRRTLIIVSVIIVLLGIGVGVYFFFFAGSATVTVAPPGSTNLPMAGQGATTPDTTTGGTTTTPPTTSTPTAASARLVQISVGPVALGESVTDAAATSASSSPETTVHYIERQSGNVFSYQVLSKKITRTSNRTLPGIQSAAWLANGSVAFVRYLSGTTFSTINTYALPTNGVSGFFLAQDLAGIAVSSTSILTLSSGVNGSTASLTRTDGTHATSAFSSPLSSLRIAFAGKQYLAFTNPTGTLPGDAFLVDATGHFSRIAGPLDGLVALPSPSGKFILVSYTLNGALQMEIVATATGVATTLPVASIADKCVWKNDDSALYCGIPQDPPTGVLYPDDWYQGAVHFSDRIWKIDVAGHYAQLVLDFSNDAKSSLDATALAVNASGTTLVFVNKNDGSLWSYSL